MNEPKFHSNQISEQSFLYYWSFYLDDASAKINGLDIMPKGKSSKYESWLNKKKANPRRPEHIRTCNDNHGFKVWMKWITEAKSCIDSGAHMPCGILNSLFHFIWLVSCLAKILNGIDASLPPTPLNAGIFHWKKCTRRAWTVAIIIWQKESRSDSNEHARIWLGLCFS